MHDVSKSTRTNCSCSESTLGKSQRTGCETAQQKRNTGNDREAVPRVRSAQRARWATVKSPEESHLTANRSCHSFSMNARFHCDQVASLAQRTPGELFFFPVWES